LAYFAETWAIKEEHVKKLEVAEMRCNGMMMVMETRAKLQQNSGSTYLCCKLLSNIGEKENTRIDTPACHKHGTKCSCEVLKSRTKIVLPL
jgi:hypothetical protein